MAGDVAIVDRDNNYLGPCDARVVWILERNLRAREAVEFMEKLRRRQHRLRCSCGRLLHVVQREHLFLRRNPDQKVGARECLLCESGGEDEKGSSAARPRSRDVAVGLILGSLKGEESRERDGSGNERTGQRSGGSGLKYASAFSVLWKLMEGAGFLSLAGPIGWPQVWAGLHGALEGYEVASVGTMDAFAWMPGRLYQGGLRGLNERLERGWRHPRLKAEGWVFFMAGARPAGGEAEVWAVPESYRNRAASESAAPGTLKPYTFGFPPSNVSTVGKGGPYLGLAVCSANDKGDSAFRKPVFHRVVLQSVVGEHNPVPVESSFEREVVLLLQRRRIRFTKPVFAVTGDLRPDFVLPELKTIVEVQGMMTEEYRARKREIHERMLHAWGSRGCRLLTYSPNEGQTLGEFERELARL